MSKVKIFEEGAIRDRLKDLPGWHYVEGSLQRTYTTAGWRATLMVVSAIGHLCEAAWHHPDLAVSYDSVIVKLSTHSAKGITEKDFAMAAKIEDVVGWQPGREGGALTGPPSGSPYLKHED